MSAYSIDPSSDTNRGWGGALLRTLLRLGVVCGFVKGVCAVYHHYQHTKVVMEVNRLREIFRKQPMLITNIPGRKCPSPVASNTIQPGGCVLPYSSVSESTPTRSPSAIRIISVTAREPGLHRWRKEEYKNGICGLEKLSARVHLFIQPRWALSPSISPACTQIETFLRVHKIPYLLHAVPVLDNDDISEIANVDDATLQYHPSGSHEETQQQTWASGVMSNLHYPLPFLVYRGEIAVGPYGALVGFLSDSFGIPSDEAKYITHAEDRAIAQALYRMIDYTLRMEYSIGMLRNGLRVFSCHAAAAFGVPQCIMYTWVAVPFLSNLKRQLAQSLQQHDLGHLTDAQLHASFRTDLVSLEELLRGDTETRPFLFGTEPTALDCAMYAYLMPIVTLGSSEAANVNDNFHFVATSPIFCGYVERMTQRAFPDFYRMADMVKGVEPIITLLRAQRERRQKSGVRHSVSVSARASVGVEGTGARQPSVADSFASCMSRATQLFCLSNSAEQSAPGVTTSNSWTRTVPDSMGLTSGVHGELSTDNNPTEPASQAKSPSPASVPHGSGRQKTTPYQPVEYMQEQDEGVRLTKASREQQPSVICKVRPPVIASDDVLASNDILTHPVNPSTTASSDVFLCRASSQRNLAAEATPDLLEPMTKPTDLPVVEVVECTVTDSSPRDRRARISNA